MCPARTGIMVHAVLWSLWEQTGAAFIAAVIGCAAWLAMRWSKWNDAAPAGTVQKAELLLCYAVLVETGNTPLSAE